MKTLFLFILAFLTSIAYGQDKIYDYAYVKGDALFVYSLVDKKEVLIEKNAIEPTLSPDGKKIAYTVQGKNELKIILIDINTKVKTILNTHSRISNNAVWSPDGNFIAYCSFNPKMMKHDICVIGSNNLSPIDLTNGTHDFYSPIWLAEGKGIVAHNMNKIFAFDLSGKVISTYDIPRGETGPNLTSEDRVIFTIDNKTMIFSNYTNEAGNGDGPAMGVFVYDLAKKASIKITPKGYDLYLKSVKGGKVFLIGSKVASNSNNAYTVDIDGKNFKMLFPNCTDISARN